MNMAPNSTAHIHNDLLSSIISDIKSYSGKDPLHPWLRGIKKMKECLPPNVLKEKLPRFLQKCAQTFESDRRYRNDLRYLRVWLQLMDCVDDPRALLSNMEMNHIGTKRSLFYQAYALYYEKLKKFEEAEKMYHFGVQNLAEPVNELEKSYEQFLCRMERNKNKDIQRQKGKSVKRSVSSASRTEENNENAYSIKDKPKRILGGSSQNVRPMKESNDIRISRTSYKVGMSDDLSPKREHVEKVGQTGVSEQREATGESNEAGNCFGDDTVVVKFVDTAIVGKPDAEDACHHGLVDPTINMKEAMNAINSMFREPIETAPAGRSHRSRTKEEHGLNNEFNVFIDENLDNRTDSSIQKVEKGTSLMQHGRARSCQPHQEPFQIFIDDEGSDEHVDGANENNNLEQSMAQNLSEGSRTSALPLNALVFPSPKDLPSDSSDDMDAESSPRIKLREDTVVHRFVGSTILDEPVVENVCHHGLVDPTINLKEAMADINNMFGKPIDFVRSKRSKKQDKAPVMKQDLGGFSILPDDDIEVEHQQGHPTARSSRVSNTDLFEPTVFTKEAMDEINKMFGMPMDF